MTNTTTELKMRTITLTDRPPVRIREDQWSQIAHGYWSEHDGQVYAQANRTWRLDIRVREHADGRAIVYGVYDYDTQFQHEAGEAHRVGVLLDPSGDVPCAIKMVAAQLIDRIKDKAVHPRALDVADECIANLPPEELT